MIGDRASLAVIAGAVALTGWLVPAAPAREFEQSSVEQAPSAIATRQMPCSAASAWSRETYKAFATCQASIYGLEPTLAHAVIEIKSGFDPDARGGAGEVGLMQVMPATARMLGFRGSLAPAARGDIRVFRPFAGKQPDRGKACLRAQVFRARPTLHEMCRLSNRGAGQTDQSAQGRAVS